MSGLLHGGDVAAFERQFQRAPRPTIDLSTGINPHAYPLSGADYVAAARLPTRDDHLRAVAAFAAYAGANQDAVFAVPGSQAAISLLPHCFESSSVAIVSPTYNEHAEAWKAANHQVVEASLEDCITREPHILVLVNPNNPTGTTLERGATEALLERQKECGGYLVIDEAFIDMTPENSLCDLVTDDGHLIILRSFGKFFGLAGLRLGFCLAPRRVQRKLQTLLGPWPIATPILEIATRAYQDGEWIKATKTRLRYEARRLKTLLSESGFDLVGGTDLYQTCHHALRDDIVTKLANAGIYIRVFPNEKGWMRFGLPANEAAWRRLEVALVELNLKGDRHG